MTLNVINIFFNFLFSLISFIGIIQSNDIYIHYLKYIGYFYFILDTLIEIFIYKKYIFIPHHIISILNIYIINDTYPYMKVFYTFFLAETTSMVVSIRKLLKNNDNLNINLDIILFTYFVFLRLILLPIINIQFKNFYITFYSSIAIYIMSLYWSYKWGKSIYKYLKKKY